MTTLTADQILDLRSAVDAKIFELEDFVDQARDAHESSSKFKADIAKFEDLDMTLRAMYADVRDDA